jgi:hypothetical protein
LSIVFIKGFARLGPAKSFMELLAAVPDSYMYFFFADQDDYWLPQKIEKAIDLLSAYEHEPALYCSQLELVDSDLNHLSYTKVPKFVSFSNSLVENIATGCTVSINARARDVLLKNIPEKNIMHDWWMYIVVSAFGTVVCDNNFYIKYRQHSGNIIGMRSCGLKDIISKFRRYIRYIKFEDSQMSLQAQEFFSFFSEFLSEENFKILQKFLDGKKSFRKRVFLIFTDDFCRQTFVGNCALKVRFLLNIY